MMGRSFWNPRSLQGLRQMNEDNLPDLCTVWDMVTQPRQSDGYSPRRKTVLETNVPCRLAPLDLRIPGHAKIADQFGPDVKWIAIFKAGYHPSGNRLFITGESNGVSYSVHLGILGEIFNDTEMLRRIACQSLSNAQAMEYET